MKELQPKLLHLQSNTLIDLPSKFYTLTIGKLGAESIPDIDLADLPGSDIVSRSHVEIRQVRGNYFIEDSNSSNGTYLNNTLLEPLKPYNLNFNDRIDLGKGQKFTLLFVDINATNYSDWIKTQLSTVQQTVKQTIDNKISTAKVTVNNQVKSAKQKVENQASSSAESVSEGLFVWYWNLHRQVSDFLRFLRKLLLKIVIFLAVILLLSVVFKISQPALTATVVCWGVPSGGEPCRIRVPYTNDNRPDRQPSCDCPFDQARDWSICGGRSAYVRPGGREPACYLGEKYARQKWYYSSETSFVDRERKGR